MNRVLLVAIVAAVGTVMMVGTSQATTPTSFSFVSQSGDFVGGGQTASFSRSDYFITSYVSPDLTQVGLGQYNSDHLVDWSVSMAIPGGVRPGTFDASTTGFPAMASLGVTGEGRGCQATGSITVLSADLVPPSDPNAQSGYIRSFDATFTQTCDGATGSLNGEVIINNPSVEPPLVQTNVTLDKKAPIDKSLQAVRVTGTWSCSASTFGFTSYVVIPQTQQGTQGVGGEGQTDCPSTPTPFTWLLYYPGTSPIRPGPATVFWQTSMVDEYHGVGADTASSGISIRLVPFV